jgi:hypothetical protein
MWIRFTRFRIRSTGGLLTSWEAIRSRRTLLHGISYYTYFCTYSRAVQCPWTYQIDHITRDVCSIQVSTCVNTEAIRRVGSSWERDKSHKRFHVTEPEVHLCDITTKFSFLYIFKSEWVVLLAELTVTSSRQVTSSIGTPKTCRYPILLTTNRHKVKSSCTGHSWLFSSYFSKDVCPVFGKHPVRIAVHKLVILIEQFMKSSSILSCKIQIKIR